MFRVFIIILIFSTLISCSRVISLDNDVKGAQNNQQTNDGSNDKTASGDTSNLAESADSDSKSGSLIDGKSDSSASSDNGGYYPDSDYITSDNSISYNDSDSMVMNSDSQETVDADSTGSTNDSGFPSGFSLDDCGCGDTPQYDPVCCKDNISVFNKCYANCFAVWGNICKEWQPDICPYAFNNDDDTIQDFDESVVPDSSFSDDSNAQVSDSDTEMPDEDISTCIPKDYDKYCCPDGKKFISKCLADHECLGQNYLCK